MARTPCATTRKLVDEALATVREDDLATIIYTSGTTGNPKGVRLSHRNFLHQIRCVPDILALKPGMKYLSFLPTWHAFERLLEYVILDTGMELHYSSKRTLKKDMLSRRPELIAAVPRVWETVYDGVVGNVEKLSGCLGKVVRGALAASETRAHALRRARGHVLDTQRRRWRGGVTEKLGHHLLALLATPPHLVADLLVYRKIRAAVGGRLFAGISGGGPLPAHVDEFLTRAGLPLLNGYGLTETAPVLSVRVPSRNILGTIGQPLPATEIRIVSEAGHPVPVGEKGVIQARGPQVMEGYHDNPEATAACLSSDGWFDTGDVGALTDENDLCITGRAKDTIVLRGGENVEPEPIEAVLCSSPLIEDAFLVGHGQKTLGAFLVPHAEALRPHTGLPESASDEAVRGHPEAEARVRAEVLRLISPDRGYRGFERIGRTAMLALPFTVEDGTLTATLKKRRKVIEARLADRIAALFGGS